MKVIDNFIADQQLLSAVRNDNSFFPESMGEGERIAEQLNSYHYQDSSVYSPYMFWDGWWKSPANTLKKKVIRAIWEKNIDYPLEDIVGFEYWTRTFGPGQVLSPHVDEDTFLYEESKTFGGPITGCVYYGEHNPDGGFLEIHKSVLTDGEKNALERENIESLFSPTEDLERIAYRGNRLVIFDTGHVLHGTTPAKSGTRQVMVVNVWHKSNPPRGLALNKFAYEAPDQTYAVEPTQFSLKVRSPLGTDDYNVEMTGKTTAAVTHYRGRVDIENVSFDGTSFSACFTVNTPMTTDVDLRFTVDRSTGFIVGTVDIGKFMSVSIEGLVVQ